MVLDPVFQISQRRCALVFGGLLHRSVVLIGDPGLLRRSRVPCKRQPHQASRTIARYVLALEQQTTEHRLSLILPLAGREQQPARTGLRILGSTLAVEKHATEAILG